MRIGSTVLLTEQLCVQSYEWRDIRPLGNLQEILDSLEEYQCDEVAIIRPVRNTDSLGRFQEDIEVIKALKSMTPISFGGGIRSHEHLNMLKDLPIERLIFSSAFLDRDIGLITSAISLFGHQAIQCMLPVAHKDGDVYIYHSAKAKYVPVSDIDKQFIDEFANEIILFDTTNEGGRNQFDLSLIEAVGFPTDKIIISGGIGKQAVYTANQKKIASVLIDNKVLHQEYSISGYKNAANMP